MAALSAVLSSGIFRRAVAFLLGLLFLFLHNKFGIDLSDADKLEITGLVGTYILGSNAKEAAMAHADAKVEAAQAMAVKAPGVAVSG